MTNKAGRRKKRNFVAFFLLMLFTNPWLANKAIGLWEIPPRPMDQEQYDVAVVLTGMTKPDLTYDDHVQFNGAAERFIEPLRLYHQKKVKKILISGGSGSLIFPELKEAPALKELALQLKVDEKDLIIEMESRNTFENAKYTSAILNEQFNDPSILLITSASHMKRSAACFKKQGLSPYLYPVDLQTNPNHQSFLKEAIPDIYALNMWTAFFHELFGYAAYWVMGYV
ncbi:MAG: YdcF family protein [Cytophagales bacterium]|nr:YdcF family protein [Cytophagales bacterium]